MQTKALGKRAVPEPSVQLQSKLEGMHLLQALVLTFLIEHTHTHTHTHIYGV